MIGQPDIERALIAQLDTNIRRGVVVSDIEEVIESGEMGVRTHYDDRVVMSKYAIGSDGSKSFVRNRLQIPFEGAKPNMTWAVLDTFLDTDFPVCSEIISFEYDGQSRVSWIPRSVISQLIKPLANTG
jgi:phenol 2-monooxygenase (NADPH)